QRLPVHMVPSSIVALDSLPKTPNGKADRRALQVMRPVGAGRDAGGPTTRDAAPRDDVERRLAVLWEEVLNVRPIGVNESFFDLGGHSLLTVRLMARVEGEFGRRLPLSTLFRGGPIAALAHATRRCARSSQAHPTPSSAGRSAASWRTRWLAG